jgi:hypothetical protein
MSANRLRRHATCPECGLPIGATIDYLALKHLNPENEVCAASGTPVETYSIEPSATPEPQAAPARKKPKHASRGAVETRRCKVCQRDVSFTPVDGALVLADHCGSGVELCVGSGTKLSKNSRESKRSSPERVSVRTVSGGAPSLGKGRR